jgi:DNA-directed RNA polymerase specialized sigma24 family protein
MVDAVLVERARAGDAQALDRLLGTAQHDLRRVARRACAVEDVDDAIQETLAQAAPPRDAARRRGVRGLAHAHSHPHMPPFAAGT